MLARKNQGAAAWLRHKGRQGPRAGLRDNLRQGAPARRTLLCACAALAAGCEGRPAGSTAPVAEALPAAPAARPGLPGSATRELVVVATSDLHGWISNDTLYPRGRPGGLAHLGPVIAELRRESPGLILLDGGDTMQGAPNLARAEREGPAGPPPVLRLMNRLGYDAMALGNHDLEAGRAALERCVGLLHYTFRLPNYNFGVQSALSPSLPAEIIPPLSQ